MSTKPIFVRRRAQAGLTLLETVLGLTILSVGLVGLNSLWDRYSDDTGNSVAASQVRTFGEAAKSYIKDNYAAVQAVATATAPALIDVSTLIAAGKLPTGYVNSNAFGQTTCALVLEPTANRLQAMVITEGGTTVGDPDLGQVAGVVGGSGGGVYSTDTATIKGAVGGWTVPVSDFDNKVNNLSRKCDGTAGNVRVTAGHPTMALWFENGDTSSAFVARDAVPGRPELNAMNTPLVMNSVQTLNGACSTTGAIAQDGAGSLLTCQSGTWKPAGDGKCVQTTSDLNSLQSDGRCYNGVALPNSPAGGEWVFVEVYRHVNAANYYLVQRVVGMTGTAVGKTWTRTQNSATAAGGWGSWLQQADPAVSIASGNVAAAGNVTGAYLYSSGDVQANGSLRSNAHTVNRNGQIINISNDWGLVTYTAAGAMLAEPQSGRASLHVNDIYIRAIGKWASQLGNSKTLVGYGSVAGQDWINVYPPPGASTATHRIYAYATEYNQCNWERQHASNWAFEMGNGPVFLQGSMFCPGWSSISYISFAVPH